jgi:hypothetical protein
VCTKHLLCVLSNKLSSAKLFKRIYNAEYIHEKKEERGGRKYNTYVPMSKKRRTAAGFCCASTGCISALEAPGVEGEGAGTGASAPKLGKKAMITISTKLMAVGPENEEGRNA